MSESSKYGLSYIIEGQQGNDVVFSDNMNIIEAVTNARVINMTTTAAPTSPVNGNAYIVASGGTGDFLNHDGEYAYYQDQWYFFAPFYGMFVYNIADNSMYYYTTSDIFEKLPFGFSEFTQLDKKALANLNTGVIYGLEVTINGSDPTLYDISAGVGIIVDWTDPINPTYDLITYSGTTGSTTTYLATNTFTRLYLLSGGTIEESPDDQGTPLSRRTKIQLQVLIHSSHVEIESVSNDSMPAYNQVHNMADMIIKDGPFTEGLFYGANGANLAVDVSSGTYWQLYVNRSTEPDNPNNVSFVGQTTIELNPNIRDGLGGFKYLTPTSVIDPDYYDDNSGIVAAVPTDYWQIMRIWFFGQTNTHAISLGQHVYESRDQALSSIEVEDFNKYSEFEYAANTTRLVIKQGCTDLSDLSQAMFVKFNKNIPLLPGTSILELQSLVGQMKLTGFQEWSSTGTYYETGTGTFNILIGGLGWIGGKNIPWQGNQGALSLTANYTNYFYVNTEGVVSVKTLATHTDYENNFFLFEVYYDGTNIIAVRENHPIKMATATSSYLHEVIGTVQSAVGGVPTRVTTGTGTVTTDRHLKMVGVGMLYDNGIEETIPDSAGAGVIWNCFYKNASGNWQLYNSQADFNMTYNNSGTPTAGGTASNSGWIVNTIYVSKNDLNSSTPKYFSVMDTAQYSSLATAEAAINAGTIAKVDGELAKLELSQLGFVVVKNNVDGGYIAYVEVAKATLNASYIASQVNSANQINVDTSQFDGMLSSADTPAQSAFDTIDEFGKTSGFLVKDETDTTKTFSLDLTGIATTTNRTMILEDADIDWSGTDTWVMTYVASEAKWRAVASGGAGSGEANTASNVGTGTSVYYQKSGVDLQFNSVSSTTNAITVSLNETNHDIEFTLNPANIIHSALSGLTNHPVDVPGTPGTDTKYVYQITSLGAESWVQIIPSDVYKVGTPINNQVCVWTGDGTVEGSNNLTFNGSVLNVTGDITVSGTVDGRDIASDGTTLDTLNTNAVLDSDFTVNGLMVRTGVGTYTNRTITSGSVKISITNGDGVSGNTTIDLGSVSIEDLSEVSIVGLTKGDILVYNGTNLVDLTVGTNDQVLIADSTTATGVKWGNAIEVVKLPSSTNAVVDTNSLVSNTVINTYSASTDGTVKVLDAPLNSTKYYLYVSGTGVVKITNVTGDTIVHSVITADEIIGIEYSTVTTSYKVIR